MLIEICYELKNNSFKIGHIPFVLSHRIFNKNNNKTNLIKFKNTVLKHFYKTKFDSLKI